MHYDACIARYALVMKKQVMADQSSCLVSCPDLCARDLEAVDAFATQSLSFLLRSASSQFQARSNSLSHRSSSYRLHPAHIQKLLANQMKPLAVIMPKSISRAMTPGSGWYDHQSLAPNSFLVSTCPGAPHNASKAFSFPISSHASKSCQMAVSPHPSPGSAAAANPPASSPPS